VAKKVSIIDHAQAKKDREYAALVEDYNVRDIKII